MACDITSLEAIEMKAVRYWAQNEIRYEDIPKPVIGEGEALIQIGFTGVCGRDVYLFRSAPCARKLPWS